MITNSKDNAILVGNAPIGFTPIIKYVTHIINRGLVVASIMIGSDGNILMQSSIDNISIVDNMEIGGTYFTS